MQPQPDIFFRKLTEADDIEAYLTTFELLVTSASLDRQYWAFKLAPYLTGKAQQVMQQITLSLKKQFFTGTMLLWTTTANSSEQPSKSLVNHIKNW